MVEYLIALAVVHSLAVAPRAVAEPLARLYTRILDLAMPRLRRVGLRNLEMALPNLSAAERSRVIDGAFRSIARMLFTFSRFPRIHKDNIHEWIRYEGYEHFEAALARGNGVLFATAHLGNWELSAFAHALMSAPMNVVVRPLDNPRIDGLVERRRAASGNRLIGKKDFARSILQALKNNEAVGILIDQNAGLDNGVFVDFFGIPACAVVGFAKIAAHSGAAVIPGFALWSEAERKYILRFFPPLPLTGDAALDTQILHAQLECVIRRYPDQWLWMHRRWKTRPPGSRDLYSC
ncbi:MAG TPA: lysophospholipid acyltransferase family protein [Bryobacteraceae bacterium]|nr:lysophospholipid acyltransferase family protein [Bryobacteraceae bacterium]